jgi:nicotinic acid phosphoribosyltransferase
VSSLAKTICRAALFLGLLVGSSHVNAAAAYTTSSIGAQR